MVTVYDVETLKSCFTYVDINVDTEEINKFVLHEELFQLEELVEHLLKIKGAVGYNNLEFDYIIIHKILISYQRWLEALENGDITYQQIILEIYNKSQEIINCNDRDYFYKNINVPYKFHYNHQLDIYKIWHFDNSAKRLGLKALAISMNYPNVLDMPIDHAIENISLDNVIKIVLPYNEEDVLVTYEGYKTTCKYDKINFRKEIRELYKLPCLSWNNGKIGEELLLKLYCEETKSDPWVIKKLRSPIDTLALKNCIPSGIEFKTDTFKSVYNAFYNKVIDQSNFEEKDQKKNRVISVIYKGAKIDYGLGGVHGIARSGIYKSDNEKIIITADVASLYPWIPIIYNFYIKHLGPEFLKVYKESIVNVRLQEKLKPKAEQNKAIIDGLKEAANLPYGKSNEKNSFLYDPSYTMKTTVAGQLITSLLVESLCEEIPGSELIMFNTDGFEIRIDRKYKDLYFKICKNWEEKYKFTLEYDEYEKMWISNVNHYGCITTSGKIKNKGLYEVDKKIGSEPAYHKDNSFRIVPIALELYFSKGVDYKQTIYNHLNNIEYNGIKNYGIYDFCGRQKFNDSVGKINRLNSDKTAIEETKLQKNVRYFISSNGDTFIKYYHKGSMEFIHVGFKVTIFNQYYESDNYGIDYSFYIRECEKIINLLEPKQKQLL